MLPMVRKRRPAKRELSQEEKAAIIGRALSGQRPPKRRWLYSAVDIPVDAMQVMRAETPQVSSGRTREPPASHCGLVSGQQGAAGFPSRALVALFPMRQQPEFPVISVVSGCRKPAAEASR
jgi:hypothetical protein